MKNLLPNHALRSPTYSAMLAFAREDANMSIHRIRARDSLRDDAPARVRHELMAFAGLPPSDPARQRAVVNLRRLTQEDSDVIVGLRHASFMAWVVEARDANDELMTNMREAAVSRVRSQTTMHPRMQARMVHAIRALSHLSTSDLEVALTEIHSKPYLYVVKE